MNYDEFGPEAEARRLQRQAEMDAYYRDRMEDIRREERIRAEQGGGPPPGGCLLGMLLMVLWGAGLLLFGLSPADFRSGCRGGAQPTEE